MSDGGEARADAKEFARLYRLTDRQNVKDWLLSAASGSLVAAKMMDDDDGLKVVPDPLFKPCECRPDSECIQSCEAMQHGDVS